MTICVEQGFKQHSGECANDSIQMIFLFGEPFRAVVQSRLLEISTDSSSAPRSARDRYIYEYARRWKNFLLGPDRADSGEMSVSAYKAALKRSNCRIFSMIASAHTMNMLCDYFGFPDKFVIRACNNSIREGSKHLSDDITLFHDFYANPNGALIFKNIPSKSYHSCAIVECGGQLLFYDDTFAFFCPIEPIVIILLFTGRCVYAPQLGEYPYLFYVFKSGAITMDSADFDKLDTIFAGRPGKEMVKLRPDGAKRAYNIPRSVIMTDKRATSRLPVKLREEIRTMQITKDRRTGAATAVS